MSFADEMNELGRKHQYAFDQKQVEACASEFYEIIQADLKAEVVAGNLIPFGLFGQKKGVRKLYPCRLVQATSPKTPYLERDAQGDTIVLSHDEKELGALLKSLKALGASDDIRMRFSGTVDDYRGYHTLIDALFELR